MVDHVQIWFLLPISGLPCTGLLQEAMLTQCSTSLVQEGTLVSKIIMGYVSKSVVLTVVYYIKDGGPHVQICFFPSNDSPKPGSLQRVWYPL